jgi:hypothetical protein
MSPRGWYTSMATILVFLHSLSLKDSVTCAFVKGIYYPHPADHHYFNSFPTTNCCAMTHQVSQVIGCSVHNGVLDQFGHCAWCQLEISTGVWHNSIPLVGKVGYNDDTITYDTQRDALAPITTISSLVEASPVEVPPRRASPVKLDQPTQADRTASQDLVALTQSQIQQHQIEARLSAMSVLQNKINMIKEWCISIPQILIARLRGIGYLQKRKLSTRRTFRSSLVLSPKLRWSTKPPGARQVVWIEIEDADVNVEGIAQDMASVLRPFPVVVFMTINQSVVRVNDSLYDASPSLSNSPILQKFRCVKKMSNESSATQSSRNNTLPPEDSPRVPLVGGAQEREVNGEFAAARSQVDRYERRDGSKNMAEGPVTIFSCAGRKQRDPGDPRTPSHVTLVGRKIPFMGILTVEDANNVTQTVKLVFCVDINTPNHSTGQKFVVTDVMIDSLGLSLCLPRSPLTPGSSSKPASTAPNVPHLRLQELILSIAARVLDDGRCNFFDQTPSQGVSTINVTSTNGYSYSAATTASAVPSLALSLSKTNSTAKSQVPVSEHIDCNNVLIGEVEETGDLFWDYPLLPGKFTSLSLPRHTAKAKYQCNKPLIAICTILEARFEVNTQVWSRLIKGRGGSKRMLSIGYKHVVIKFDVRIDKSSDQTHFQFCSSEGTTVELHHKFDGRCKGMETETGRESREDDNVTAVIDMLAIK